ncbi:MAG: phosphotransferase family protein [Chloroflexota bacterium]
MTDTVFDSTLGAVAQKTIPGGELIHSWPLSGGVSMRMAALDVRRPDGQICGLVIRQYPEAEIRGDESLPAREFRLLEALTEDNLPASAPVYLDVSNEILPSPYLVLERIEGETVFAPPDTRAAARKLATCLARIHAHDFRSYDHAFLPSQAQVITRFLNRRPGSVDDIDVSGLIWASLQTAWPKLPRNADVLLHGDFWPGNVLWKDGHIAGVIDWEDAAIGDPLADLANSRLELLWAFGEEAMCHFTSEYERISGVDATDLHCWDLYAAFRKASQIGSWDLASEARSSMRRQLEKFVGAACDRFGQQT